MFSKHGRYMTKGGYVDSSRRVRSLHRQQDDQFVPQHQTSPSRGGLLAAINKSSLSPSSAPPTTITRRLKFSSGVELPSVISIPTNLDNKNKEHDKQMRLIEVYLLSSIEMNKRLTVYI
jgi:hypothetical protein